MTFNFDSFSHGGNNTYISHRGAYYWAKNKKQKFIGVKLTCHCCFHFNVSSYLFKLMTIRANRRQRQSLIFCIYKRKGLNSFLIFACSVFITITIICTHRGSYMLIKITRRDEGLKGSDKKVGFHKLINLQIRLSCPPPVNHIRLLLKAKC